MIRAFEPQLMKLGILTAAFQELTPREKRDQDPDLAIEEWFVFARELGADYIQLSAAFHPSESDVPPESMLDPVANTLDLREPFDQARSQRVTAAAKQNGVGISDIAYFDNLLHHDAALRQTKREFLLRVFDAAVLLGVDAVCGFIGRNQQHSMDQNLLDFETHFIPLLKAAQERNLTYRLEQCPMPGWIHEILDSRRRITSAQASLAESIAVVGDDLVFRFGIDKAAAKESLEEPATRKILAEVARDAFGRPLRIVLKTGPPADGDLGQAAREVPREALSRERASNKAETDPVVRSALELFRGELTEVKEEE